MDTATIVMSDDLIAYTKVLGLPHISASEGGGLFHGWIFHWKGGHAVVAVEKMLHSCEPVRHKTQQYPTALEALWSLTKSLESFHDRYGHGPHRNQEAV